MVRSRSERPRTRAKLDVPVSVCYYMSVLFSDWLAASKRGPGALKAKEGLGQAGSAADLVDSRVSQEVRKGAGPRKVWVRLAEVVARFLWTEMVARFLWTEVVTRLWFSGGG